ncbi:hypothetical protein CBR_g44939 [Chara braunii]|uniref:GPI transamidase component PIG-T n=1 Tax=Chara braunii TaxID=69332 RepID=A0A388LY68_CHABU|nr:hypothetical protein CBR_g44939 [Chara braunii]|eukprot:GBG87203.1 hypothetical protein CBR_g44939 [Chara braunii]
MARSAQRMMMMGYPVSLSLVLLFCLVWAQGLAATIGLAEGHDDRSPKGGERATSRSRDRDGCGKQAADDGSSQFSHNDNGYAERAREEFSEELLLRPLVDGKVLAHFLFTHKLPRGNNHHHRIFPKAMDQLVRKFSVREMDLSFTQGRWDYGRWGSVGSVTAAAARPKGLALWAWMSTPAPEVDLTWRNLTHALSGLFCASINFLEHTATIASPTLLFRPDLHGEGNGTHRREGNGRSVAASESAGRVSGEERGACVNQRGDRSEMQCSQIRGKEQGSRKGGRAEESCDIPVRYGALPRESVCTENLTPWLKLLPCRDKAGLASLLDRPSIYRGYYHSLRVHVRAEEGEDIPTGAGYKGRAIVVEQSLTLVLKPGLPKGVNNQDSWGLDGGEDRAVFQRDWSLSSLFGRNIGGPCPVAKESRVFLEVDDGLRRAFLIGKGDGREDGNPVGLRQWEGAGNLVNNSVYEVHPRPSAIKEISRSRSLEKPVSRCGSGSSSEERSMVANGEPTEGEESMPPVESPSACAADPADGRATGRGSSVLQYDLKRPDDNSKMALPFDLSFRWRRPMAWLPPGSPISVSSFVTGYGNDRGGISTVFRISDSEGGLLRNDLVECATGWSGDEGRRFQDADIVLESSKGEATGLRRRDQSSREGVYVTVFQMVPWYIRLYIHTLSVEVNGHLVPLKKVLNLARFVPAEDRLSPWVMELRLRLPVGTKTMSISLEFDKGFLRIDEHPPDASRGLDLPSAVVAFERVASCHSGQARRATPLCEAFVHGMDALEANTGAETSPLLQNLQAESAVHIYTESLLVPLAIPDFSMPYNVITLTCTAIAVFFGSMFNALKRRYSEVPRRVNLRTAIAGRLSVLRRRLLMGKGAAAEAGKKVPSMVAESQTAAVFSRWSLILGKVRKIILVALFICFAGYYLLDSEK